MLRACSFPQGPPRDCRVTLQTPSRPVSSATSGTNFIPTKHSSPGSHGCSISSRYSSSLSSIPPSISALNSSVYSPNRGEGLAQTLSLSHVSTESATSNNDKAASSPIPRKLNNLRTLTANENSIRGKAAELQNLVCTTIPDIIQFGQRYTVL